MSFSYKLKNGITVFILPGWYKQIVSCYWYIHAGSNQDFPERQGLAHFIEHMFFKGTKEHKNASSLIHVLDEHGAQTNAFTTQEMTCYHCHISSDVWEKAIQTLSEMIYDSIFPKSDYKFEKEIVVQELKQRKTNPSILIQDSMTWILSGTPYARSVGGTPEQVQSITSDDLNRFIHLYYQPDRMYLFLVGDLPNQKQIQKVLHQYVDRVGNRSKNINTHLPEWWKYTKQDRIGREPIVWNGTIKQPNYPGPSIQWILNETDEQTLIKIDYPIWEMIEYDIYTIMDFIYLEYIKRI